MDWFAMVNTVAVVAAAGVALWQITLLRREHAEAHERLLRGRALEYSLTRAPHLRKLRTAVDAAFPPGDVDDPPISIEELQRSFDADEQLQQQLIALLAHWENLALTVAADVTDESMAFEMVASTLVRYEGRFSEFIADRRRTQNPRVYAYLTALAHRWRSRLKDEEPGRLFGADWTTSYGW